MSDERPAIHWAKRCGGILERAAEEAERVRHSYVGVEHLWNALARQPGGLAERLLRVAAMEPAAVRDAIRREAGTGSAPTPADAPLTPRSLDVLRRAERRAGLTAPICEQHLLEAILEEGQSLPVRYLASMGHDAAELLSRLASLVGERNATGRPAGFDAYDRTIISEDLSAPGTPSVDLSHAPPVTAVSNTPPAAPTSPVPGPPIAPPSAVPVSLPTPTLDSLGRDLTKLARLGRLSDAIGREEEIEQIITVLARTQKSNPLLLGEAGVGKTAIIEGLAWRIAQGQAPAVLRGKRIVEIDMGTIVAGTTYRGDMEKRIRDLLSEATNAPEVILFIDEVHTIVGAGKGEGAMDAAQLFKPALARGDISCIGATTQDEYSRYIRKDAALERRFSPVNVKEMNPEATLRVLQKVVPRIVQKQASRSGALTITPDAIRAAVTLTDRYVKDRHQPDKAIDALDIAAARAIVQGLGSVTADDVARVVSDWTGVSTERLTADRREQFGRMEQVLAQRVIGQDAAVAAVSRTIRAAMAGLKPPNRPIGVFLFVGPSGVGKTKLGKELAAFLFDSPDALIRFDMGEYQEKHTVSNLIGSPRGYIGSEDSGHFTEALRRRPYSVVLLDEIEKAHPDVLHIFLSVFDDGRVTDNHGRLVDCSNALFILTSNLAMDDPGRSADLRGLVARFLRPELINRLTDVVRFEPLGRTEMGRILDQIVADRSGTLHVEHGITITMDESARDLVLGSGFDAQMGARPLERAVEQMIIQPLVASIFSGRVTPGELTIAARSGEIAFVRGEGDQR